MPQLAVNDIQKQRSLTKHTQPLAHLFYHKLNDSCHRFGVYFVVATNQSTNMSKVAVRNALRGCSCSESEPAMVMRVFGLEGVFLCVETYLQIETTFL